MIERADTLLQMVRILFMGILVLASIFLLSILFKSFQTAHAATANTPQSASYSDEPNTVALGISAAASDAGEVLNATGNELIKNTQSATSVLADGTKSVGNGVMLGLRATGRGLGVAGRAAGKGVGATANTLGGGVVYVLRIPGNVLSFVTDASVVRAVIRPSDRAEVPIIDPNSPELKAALATLPPAPAQQPTPAGQGPIWPINGNITTHFGVPHWPYQRTHSGIDIAGGRRAGAAPIKPFRPGRVIDVIHSRTGLGNHVVVDHGNGISSVYAHLYSTAVHVGQSVTIETVLGQEGSTGASTGTHLHFEIRVNGQATDPRPFINGLP